MTHLVADNAQSNVADMRVHSAILPHYGVFRIQNQLNQVLVVRVESFLGLGGRHAGQVGLPADVIHQHGRSPAGLLLVACAHHGRALAGMVQEHDRAPGIGGDGLHAANHLRHDSIMAST